MTLVSTGSGPHGARIVRDSARFSRTPNKQKEKAREVCTRDGYLELRSFTACPLVRRRPGTVRVMRKHLSKEHRLGIQGEKACRSQVPRSRTQHPVLRTLSSWGRRRAGAWGWGGAAPTRPQPVRRPSPCGRSWRCVSGVQAARSEQKLIGRRGAEQRALVRLCGNQFRRAGG